MQRHRHQGTGPLLSWWHLYQPLQTFSSSLCLSLPLSHFNAQRELTFTCSNNFCFQLNSKRIIKANNSSDPLNSELYREFEVNTSPSYIHRSSLFSSLESRLLGTLSRCIDPLTDLICSCIGTNCACVSTRISLQVDDPITQVFHDEYPLASWGL